MMHTHIYFHDGEDDIVDHRVALNNKKPNSINYSQRNPF